MSGELNIDSELLISLVEERPILWDKTFGDYKDKRLTCEAWKEVCEQVIEDFETLPDKEQSDMGRLVMKKWANIRDNWMKCHKRLDAEQRFGAVGKKKRKYMFYEELQFLQKIVTHRPPYANVFDNVATADIQNDTQEEKSSRNNEKLSRGKRTTNELDKKIITADASVEERQSRIMHFFKGIAPTVDKFDDEDIIDFQYEVIKLIKNIKSKNQKNQIPVKYSEFP